MKIRELVHRFAFHAILALAVWCVLAFFIERLIPGSISPFVDLVDLGLMMAVAVVVGAVTYPEASQWKTQLVYGVLVFVGGCIALLLLWSRVSGYGWYGRGLMGVAFVLLSILAWVPKR